MNICSGVVDIGGIISKPNRLAIAMIFELLIPLLSSLNSRHLASSSGGINPSMHI
jgi:hypothetical protein